MALHNIHRHKRCISLELPSGRGRQCCHPSFTNQSGCSKQKNDLQYADHLPHHCRVQSFGIKYLHTSRPSGHNSSDINLSIAVFILTASTVTQTWKDE